MIDREKTMEATFTALCRAQSLIVFALVKRRIRPADLDQMEQLLRAATLNVRKLQESVK